jgi:steroid delta-isomerase-like uncharacterized protein
MSTQDNKALAHRFIEAINQKDFALIDQIYAPTYVRHDPANPQVRSREDYKQWLTQLCTAFPDLQFTIDDLMADGDKIICRFTSRGTHTGQWRGMPTTSKQAVVTGIGVSHIVEGKVVEDWYNTDILGLVQQLGVALPTTGELPRTALPTTGDLLANTALIEAEQIDKA